MMYYALITGAGEGCDYTIACNKAFKKLDANTQEEALKETKELWEYYSGEERIESIQILEVTKEISANVESFVFEARKNREEEAKKEQDEKDRRDFERLKTKFNQ